MAKPTNYDTMIIFSTNYVQAPCGIKLATCLIRRPISPWSNFLFVRLGVSVIFLHFLGGSCSDMGIYVLLNVESHP